MAACGMNFTLAVTEDGSLYSWGEELKGKLGNGKARYIQMLPERVKTSNIMGCKDIKSFDKRIDMVSAGMNHSAAVTEDGSLYMWGTCFYLEQGWMRPMWQDKKLWGGSPAVQVACGSEHTIMLTAVGRVYTYGCGLSGQLGHGDRTDKHVLTQVGIEHFKGVRIVMVAAGHEHCAAVGEDGSVFTLGGGNYGRLGHNDEEHRLVPTQLAVEAMDGAKVVMVAAGGNHTVAVAQDGVLWVWGCGECGQLGLGDRDNRLVPTRVPVEAFGGSRVLMAACGYAHTLAVTEDGNVYSCGKGHGGRLGHNNHNDSQVFTRIAAQHFGLAKIVSASAGCLHSSAVTENGALYTWGKGQGLGHGNKEDKWVPTRVDMELLDNKRIGRYHNLRPEFALAFAMGAHDRLGEMCTYKSMPLEVIQKVIETVVLHPEGRTQELEGVVRLIGGGLKTDWRRKSLL